MKKEPPSYNEVRAVIEYDPKTGLFRRIRHLGGKRNTEWFGGSPHSGYRRVQVCGQQHLSHRVAWLLMTGSWPEFEIDHIDGHKANNRWANLRRATRFLNNQNMRKARAGNPTGVLGVSYDARFVDPYVARICHNRQRVYLGRFATLEEAEAAYLKAKRKLHQGFVERAA